MYKIETDNFTKAVADLVAQFKQENPSVGRFKCVCHDGTVVDIKIEARKRKSKKAAVARSGQSAASPATTKKA